MKIKIPHLLAAVFSLVLLSGCTSFNLRQTVRFINEDGDIIVVDYGDGDSEYVTKFNAPRTGKPLEFKSKLRVFVTMPDGESFYAFECVNELRTGAMYQSSDEEWYYHANGFVCTVYHRIGDTRDFKPVFTGVVCQSPEKPRPEQRR